jgi:P pilus assembly chaperone PapD
VDPESGNSATTMQVRIVRWKQEDGHERYTAQQDVVASPPIVTIGTGSKQLIRLSNRLCPDGRRTSLPHYRG